MATFFTDADVDRDLILSQSIGVIGYGNQGHAHALNLRDSGCRVAVALYEGSRSRVAAKQEGFEVVSVTQATQACDILMFCTPDIGTAALFRENVEDHLRKGQTLLFAHGMNIHAGLLRPPPFVDVGMVSPKGPGRHVRSEFLRGSGLPSLVAVHQDATGNALAKTLGYAWAIGCTKKGALLTTFQEETESDLFGEQAVLCGGIPALILAGYETLVAAGYQPEVAYFECLHEAKLIVDLLHEGGYEHMRQAISDTAEWGGYLAGQRLVTDETKRTMQTILERIRNGSFVREWVEENERGRGELERLRVEERRHGIDAVGDELRRRFGAELARRDKEDLQD